MTKEKSKALPLINAEKQLQAQADLFKLKQKADAKLASLTVGDIISSKEWRAAARDELSKIRKHFKKLISDLQEGYVLKSTPYKHLYENGYFLIDKFEAEYRKCCDKKSELPRSQRDVIAMVGATCFYRACIKISDSAKQ